MLYGLKSIIPQGRSSLLRQVFAPSYQFAIPRET